MGINQAGATANKNFEYSIKNLTLSEFTDENLTLEDLKQNSNIDYKIDIKSLQKSNISFLKRKLKNSNLKIEDITEGIYDIISYDFKIIRVKLLLEENIGYIEFFNGEKNLIEAKLNKLSKNLEQTIHRSFTVNLKKLNLI